MTQQSCKAIKDKKNSFVGIIKHSNLIKSEYKAIILQIIAIKSIAFFDKYDDALSTGGLIFTVALI